MKINVINTEKPFWNGKFPALFRCRSSGIIVLATGINAGTVVYPEKISSIGYYSYQWKDFDNKNLWEYIPGLKVELVND